jgi:hypothetical protein
MLLQGTLTYPNYGPHLKLMGGKTGAPHEHFCCMKVYAHSHFPFVIPAQAGIYWTPVFTGMTIKVYVVGTKHLAF